jgi:5-methylcytosine-specific restriction endonuclease McrA
MLIRKGDVGAIRKELYRRDKGVCAGCGIEASEWQADHIIAVVNGGGGCGLEGFQTLCLPCHKRKTITDVRQSKITAKMKKYSDQAILFPDQPGH